MKNMEPPRNCYEAQRTHRVAITRWRPESGDMHPSGGVGRLAGDAKLDERVAAGAEQHENPSDRLRPQCQTAAGQS